MQSCFEPQKTCAKALQWNLAFNQGKLMLKLCNGILLALLIKKSTTFTRTSKNGQCQYKKQPPQVFCKIDAFNNLANFQGKISFGDCFENICFEDNYFPKIFAEILRVPILSNTYDRVFLSEPKPCAVFLFLFEVVFKSIVNLFPKSISDFQFQSLDHGWHNQQLQISSLLRFQQPLNKSVSCRNFLRRFFRG